jgi:hypothetical protein
MVELKNNVLTFRFPEIHEDAVCSIDFQRTLRIPDDNRPYPLPPGLGNFPMEHVEDHASRLPAAWSEHGGALLPMYQAEALWIQFDRGNYPFAIKIAAGKINAVTGGGWSNALSEAEQDYLVIPDQPWLDGFCVQKGFVRQFVAMPLGSGYTAEEQITGAAAHGGIQVIAYPMKREWYEALLKERAHICEDSISLSLCGPSDGVEYGLAPGGLMKQEIYEDEYGHDAWDQTQSSRCFVHILNSDQWMAATGQQPPGEPPTAERYAKAGLPWFDYYDDRLNVKNGSSTLAGMDSVAAKGIKLGQKPLANNQAIEGMPIVTIGPKTGAVKDGAW